MIRKESYGFNTFAGLNLGEIQQKTNRNEWLHIPSKQNISDILTREAPPSVLGPSSVWQQVLSGWWKINQCGLLQQSGMM